MAFDIEMIKVYDNMASRVDAARKVGSPYDAEKILYSHLWMECEASLWQRSYYVDFAQIE
jgi:hypothetical protein